MLTKLRIMMILLFTLINVGSVVGQEENIEGGRDSNEYAIVFTSDASRSYADIYIVEDQDSRPVLLIENALARHPSFSPTDPVLAFVTSGDRNEELLLFDFRESKVTRLVSDDSSKSYLRWSPDGQQIAYAASVNGKWEIFVLELDGSNQLNITNQPTTNEGIQGFDWSPDGQQIVFTSDRDGNVGLYTMNSDGTDQKYLLDIPPLGDTYPVWSPHSEEIAFATFRGEGAGIYLLKLGDSELRLLISMNGIPSNLDWSPDGAQISYTLCEGTSSSCEIYLVDIETSQNHRLTDNMVIDNYSSWVSVETMENISGPFDLSDYSQEDGS